MNHGILPYIGGKHRLATRIAPFLQGTGADTMVDVFGGSGAVIIASGFNKRIYNDADSDLVNFFEVISDPETRRWFIKRVRWLPPSREMFDKYRDVYLRGSLSFRLIEDPIKRALATFTLHMLSFGGKTRSGGFSVSTRDRYDIKEVGRYRNSLRKVVKVGEFFRRSIIENMHYSAIVSKYGKNDNVVLFCDPPYYGTENHYSVKFTKADHTFLANQLASVQASVVLTYCETPEIRKLYPDNRWDWHAVRATKNSAFRRGNKEQLEERIIVKRNQNERTTS